MAPGAGVTQRGRVHLDVCWIDQSTYPVDGSKHCSSILYISRWTRPCCDVTIKIILTCVKQRVPANQTHTWCHDMSPLNIHDQWWTYVSHPVHLDNVLSIFPQIDARESIWLYVRLLLFKLSTRPIQTRITYSYQKKNLTKILDLFSDVIQWFPKLRQVWSSPPWDTLHPTVYPQHHRQLTMFFVCNSAALQNCNSYNSLACMWNTVFSWLSPEACLT